VKTKLTGTAVNWLKLLSIQLNDSSEFKGWFLERFTNREHECLRILHLLNNIKENNPEDDIRMFRMLLGQI
jgi:hypothetical protein